MYEYLTGEITLITASYVVLDVNGVGYKIFTPNPYMFKEKCEYRVYLYNQLREDDSSLFGFKELEERDFFLKLINVKGLGPRIALPILATGSISGIVDAIDRENILYLKKFPKIGEKLAKQIILDLKGKLISVKDTKEKGNEELILALESLGYKRSDIKSIISQVDYTKTIEEQIKDALKLLLR